MQGSIPASARRSDHVAQGAVFEYNVRLEGASYYFVDSTMDWGYMSATSVDPCKPRNILEDRGIDNGSLNPRGVHSRRVLRY